MQLYDADLVNHMRLSDTLRKQLDAATALHGSQFTAALQVGILVRCTLAILSAYPKPSVVTSNLSAILSVRSHASGPGQSKCSAALENLASFRASAAES